jgi:hypothetical protein
MAMGYLFREFLQHVNQWSYSQTGAEGRRCDVGRHAAEVIGPTLEGKTERQKNPHPPRSLAWLA